MGIELREFIGRMEDTTVEPPIDPNHFGEDWDDATRVHGKQNKID